MKENNYTIPLGHLAEGEHDYHFVCTREMFESLGREGILDSNVNVDVAVIRKGDRYTIECDLTGDVTVPCHRCLEPLKIPVDEQYDFNVRYGEEYDDSTDGLIILPDSQLSLDLAPALADTIQLAVPMRAVHPDGQCNPEMERLISGDED